MTYVLLIYHGASLTTPLPPDEQKRVYAEWDALNKTPGFTGGLPLGLPENATTVRVQDGKTLTHRRPVRRDQGGDRRLRHPRGRRPGCGHRGGHADPTGPPGRRHRDPPQRDVLVTTSNRSSATSGAVCWPR
jgi:hypothetical protein